MPSRRRPRRIHITAVASPAPDVPLRLGVKGIAGLVELAQRGAGDRYRVTASEKMILAGEIENEGGRFDDAARAREIESLLSDDEVAAVVTIRGGAWFARVLDRIDWDVLRRRRRRVHLFGFSEMTPLIAIAGRYPKAVGLYDMGPAFLYGGVKRWARQHVAELTVETDKMTAEQKDAFASGWAAGRFAAAFTGFFGEVATILDGRGCPRVPTGRLLAGTLRPRQSITITGGNLSLIEALIGSRFRGAVETRGKWLAIEDVNEPADRIDRMMAALRLHGLFERADGVILGDFHKDDADLCEAAYQVLRHHLPARPIPVVRIENFGHIYPIAPLPMHRPVTLRCAGAGRSRRRVTIEIPWGQWIG